MEALTGMEEPLILRHALPVRSENMPPRSLSQDADPRTPKAPGPTDPQAPGFFPQPWPSQVAPLLAGENQRESKQASKQAGKQAKQAGKQAKQAKAAKARRARRPNQAPSTSNLTQEKPSQVKPSQGEEHQATPSQASPINLANAQSKAQKKYATTPPPLTATTQLPPNLRPHSDRGGRTRPTRAKSRCLRGREGEAQEALAHHQAGQVPASSPRKPASPWWFA